MNANSNALDFRNPETMSEELLSVPGFVNELKDYTLSAKAHKLAVLHAISENPERPVMTPDAVRWATAFATHVTKKMLYEAQFNVSEGSFDRLKQRFVAQLVKAGGQLDRSTLLKNLHVDVTTFQRIVLTLHACDMIEEERIDLRKTIITLKTAA